MTNDSEIMPPHQKPKLARWFWGSIILMAAISISLSVMAVLRQSDDLGGKGDSSSGETHVPTETIPETSALDLEMQLNKANKAALEAVITRVGPLLDVAYQPAYDAIPAYANFHYSVWGEYAELSAAAIGDVSGKLKEMLFADMEARLREVSAVLDDNFNSAFELELAQVSGGTGGIEIGLGPLTKVAVENSLERMQVTVPISTAAALGTAAAIKSAATAMAKKIAAKLAVKAAAKTGGKWAAAGTGAGTGAALCSWSGPGAGLCAAVGGVGAWIITDYGIMKLDEFWNRDEFEADLREMIDQHKAEYKATLELALSARASAVQEMVNEVVQDHDFTLRDLSGVGNAEICKVAASLAARYEPMRDHLRERSPEALRALRTAMSGYESNLSLRPLVQEIERNLKTAMKVTVVTIQVEGNLPQAQRADREITGRLLFDETPLDIPRSRASVSSGFVVHLQPDTVLSATRALTFAIMIEQHLRLSSNRYFVGAGKVMLFDAFRTSDGLEHTIRLSLPIAYQANTGSTRQVTPNMQAGGILTLSLLVRSDRLAELEEAPGCK